MAEPLPVLVVDDDRHMLRTLSDILTLRGYAPRTAPSGREGLEQAGRMGSRLAIAVVDLRLPDMDGIELIGHLHALSDLTEVVVLTGNATVESAVMALREQSFDYLTKPVEPARLLDTLARARERWHRKLAESALGQSEERMRRMFHAIGDAVFITDHEGRIVEFNQAALDLTGFTGPDLVTLSLRHLLKPRAGPGVRPGSGGVDLPEVSALAFGEFVLTTRSGEPLITEMRTAAFDPDRYVHTARDLTDRIRLEEQIQRSQRMEAVGQLAGGLAHDFNNVLTAISGYAHLLSIELVDHPELLDDLSEIMQASSRAAGLTRQLLTFSRRQVTAPQVLSLNALVTGMEGMLRRLVPDTVTFHLHIADDAGNVVADTGQLEQVLVNLVVNAGDAMSEGGVLTVSTATLHFDHPPPGLPDLVPGRFAALRVEDTGTGMDAGTLRHIFEPFFTTKEVGKGTGLGLATVYGIATQSGGHIDVWSRPGEGTRFTVLFPRVDAEADEPVSRDGVPVHLLSGSETILLAEENRTIRALMRRSLEQYGYRVLEAEGHDALARAVEHEGPIHVMLLDALMPGAGGGEIAATVSALHPETRFIVTSGNSSGARVHADSIRAMFLEKPFTTEGLLRRIRETMDTPRP